MEPIPASENSRTEFKEILTGDLEKEVISMLNGDGGNIYIGIDKKGAVIGLQDTDLLQRQITDRIKNNILPDTLGLFEVTGDTVQGKNIIIITLAKGTEKPYYITKYGMSPKGCYLRVGSSSQPMSVTLINSYLQKRTAPTLSSLPSPVQNLSFTRLQIYYSGRNMTLPPLFPENLGLKTEDGRYNYTAYLLADVNDITMRVARYAGTDRLNLVSNDEYGYCSLLTAADKILEKLDVLNTNYAAVNGVLRTEKRLVDTSALREAVLNAIVHNDYSHGQSPVIEVYSDRIEITSAGGLSQDLTEEEFYLGYSAPRNRVLMRIFRDLGYVEHLGNGLRKILVRYGRSVFTLTPHFLKVTFRFETGSGEERALREGESALHGEESALSDGESALRVEGEQQNTFEQMLASKLGETVTVETREKVRLLFRKTGYRNPLRRKDILEEFGVKDRRAAALLKQLTDAGVLIRTKRDTYYFVHEGN